MTTFDTVVRMVAVQIGSFIVSCGRRGVLMLLRLYEYVGEEVATISYKNEIRAANKLSVG